MSSDALWELDLDPLRGYIPFGNSKLRPSYFSTSRSRVSHSWPREDSASPPARQPPVFATHTPESPPESTAARGETVSPSCANPITASAFDAEELEHEDDSKLPSPSFSQKNTDVPNAEGRDEKSAISALAAVAAEVSRFALQCARLGDAVKSALQLTDCWVTDLEGSVNCCHPASGAAVQPIPPACENDATARLWIAGKTLSTLRADVKLLVLGAVAEASRASASHQSRLAEILDAAGTSAGRAHDMHRGLTESINEELRALRAHHAAAITTRDSAAVRAASVRMDTCRVDSAQQRLKSNEETTSMALSTILAQVGVLSEALEQRSALVAELADAAKAHKASIQTAQDALGQAELELQATTSSLQRAQSASAALHQLTSMFRPAVPICSPARTPAPQRRLATPDRAHEDISAQRPERRLTELTQLAPPIIAWSPMPTRTPRGEAVRQEVVRSRRRADQVDLAATISLFHRSGDVAARWVTALRKLDVETLADIRTLYSNKPLWRDCLSDNALLKAHLETLIADPAAHDIEF